MAVRNPGNPNHWTWSQACDLLDQAERMHRQFFRLAAAGQTRVAWEPPVDIVEDERHITIIVALPGVPQDCVEIINDYGTLVVRATRRMPLLSSAAVVRRIEIPYGVFERRIALPERALENATREFLNGCLILTLHKQRPL